MSDAAVLERAAPAEELIRGVLIEQLPPLVLVRVRG
jgi:hypothetical protein